MTEKSLQSKLENQHLLQCCSYYILVASLITHSRPRIVITPVLRVIIYKVHGARKHDGGISGKKPEANGALQTSPPTPAPVSQMSRLGVRRRLGYDAINTTQMGVSRRRTKQRCHSLQRYRHIVHHAKR